tara:strand:+ start:515 stop:667 length:153 start_codon:yes stop_codon:yes gene_type:complete
MRSPVVSRDHLWSIEAGPIKVDYGNPSTDLAIFSSVLVLLVLFRWVMKKV